MTRTMRVVVDTNVLVSGMFGIKDSPSSYILKAIRNQEIILVTSPLILEEITEVISRERIRKLTKMTKEQTKSFMEDMIKRSNVTKGLQLLQIVGRDTKDDKFLAAAYEAKANYIVTGDDDLLILREYKSIKIIRPRDFIDLLRKEGIS